MNKYDKHFTELRKGERRQSALPPWAFIVIALVAILLAYWLVGS
jgi:type VI protein secretion system component VasF